MKFDFDSHNRSECSKLLAGMVIPRPVAWVSTIGEDGTFNLAPFSFFGAVAGKPPIIYISIGRRQGRKKDTLRNIEYAKDFVVNVVDETMAKSMNQTSADYPSNVSEFQEAGLTPLPGDKVMSPRVAESPINMECRLLQILEFGEMPNVNNLVIGEIVGAHVRDTLFRDNTIDVSQLKIIGRLGGDLYCQTRDIFEMKRPE